MKLISWNVNGLRACMTQGVLELCGEKGLFRDGDFYKAETSVGRIRHRN